MALKKKIIQDELANIKNQIDTDFFPIINRTKHSYFAILLLVFSLTDYLGSLYKGTNSSRNAVSFVREFFSKSNIAYEDCAGILYFIYRHGTVHQRIPKLTQLRSKGGKMSWYITKNVPNRHLRGFKMSNNSAKGLVISMKSLILDLKKAVEEYEKDLLANTPSATILRKNFSKAYKEARIFRKENLLLVDPQAKYLDIKDFDFIREQLRHPLILKS